MARDPIDSSTDRANWDSAWHAIRRLADVRQNALQDSSHRSSLAQTEAAGGRRATIPVDLEVGQNDFDSSQLERDIIEIEHASAALRRAEPALEEWPARSTPATHLPQSGSVWILIGVIWTSTALVMVALIAAIMRLV
jgi:hypothetical protein